MPIKLLEKNNFDYTKGLFTEASPLTRPDGTSMDELNYTLQRTGGRKRRYGWKKVAGSSVPEQMGSAYTKLGYINVVTWENAGTPNNYPVIVVRIKDNIYFFSDTGDSVTPYSQYNRIDMRVFLCDNNVFKSTDTIDMVAGANYLFVTGQNYYPFYISYEYDTIAGVGGYYFRAREIPVVERDLEGLDDGFGWQTRPTINDPNWAYNMYNRGWNAAKIAAYYAASGSLYPSKNMIYYAGKYINPATGLETFSATELNNQEFGNVSAPQGRFTQFFWKHNYVTDEINKAQVLTVTYVPGAPNRIRLTHKDPVIHAVNDYIMLRDVLVSYKDVSGHIHYETLNGYWPISVYHGVGDVSIDYTLYSYNSNFQFYAYGDATMAWSLQFKYTVPGGFQGLTNGFRTIAYHAGRVWYAGLDDPYRSLYSKRIYFSQSITDKTKFGLCYSENDPTAEYQNDPLDTDGGFIYIPEIGTIHKLMPMGNLLLVFADNGVWAIIPGDQGFFTATSYAVDKISDATIVDAQSAVYAGGTVFFWSNDGISAVGLDQVSTRPVIQNITNGVIKSELQDRVDMRGHIRAAYDKQNNIIYWLYSDGTIDDANNRMFNNRILCLDLIKQGFYKWSAPYYNANHNTDFGCSLYPVYSKPANFYISATDAQVDPSKRLLLLRGDIYSGTEYVDFYRMGEDASVSGNDYQDEGPVSQHHTEVLPYLTASYEYGTGPHKQKWGQWVDVFFNRTENKIIIDGSGNITLQNKSGCTMQARWDFADTATSNKWDTAQQVYRLQRFYQPTTSTPGTYDWENGYPVVKTRNRIRGSGTVLSLRFDGQTGKACDLLGWSVDMLETSETR